MEFSELVKRRRSIHHFTKDEVTNEELDYVLEAARWAPSAGNAQPWSFIVVKNSENREKVLRATAGIPNARARPERSPTASVFRIQRSQP